MSDVQVTLTPLSLGQNIPRTFTLTPDHPELSIGRSSKRDVKNRFPATNNGWFDSGVMSREHALFSVCLERKNIYITDTHSTHGTWLNNVRLIEGEPTPLICDDVLRFGITVDRGHEIVSPVSVQCRIVWSEHQSHRWGAPELTPSDHAAEPEKSADPRPLAILRPSSTNTFCVPDESDVEELPNPKINLPDETTESFHSAGLQASQEAFSHSAEEDSVNQENSQPQETSQTIQVQQSGCIILEKPEEQMDGSDEDSDDFLDSEEEDEDLESSASPSSDPSTFSYDNNGVGANSDRAEISEPSDDEYSRSELGSDGESAASLDGKFLDNDQAEFINPDVLVQNNTFGATPLNDTPKVSGNRLSSTAPATTNAPKLSPKKPGPVHVEVCGGVHRPHPHSVITPEELPQSLPTPESYQATVYQEGPFSYINIPGAEESTTQNPPAKPAWPLKRKISEMETQDAQIIDSTLPASQADLNTLPTPEVIDAISSALSESGPPKKRVKSSHSASGTIASYTATAVISALLGGLGTIALLAALPAEYFQ